MTKILIATPLYPPDIGGPALYAKNLEEEFLKSAGSARVVKYKIEKYLPTGIRHFVYFVKVLFLSIGADFILALDTFSVGFPTVLASVFTAKKVIIRVGGDFLWESYVARTASRVPLKGFNEGMPPLSFKEKVIFSFSAFALRRASAVVFSTSWQKEIFRASYRLNSSKLHVIENFYPAKDKNISNEAGGEKNFIWAGRNILIKNVEMLRSAFGKAVKEREGIHLDIVTGVSHEELLEKMKGCYAVILPTLTEVSPNFILDAIRLNKPFILTRETGFYEKLKDIGLFVDPFDEEDIKQKILLLSDDNNYNEYRRRISEFSFTHSWPEIASEFLEVYKKL